MIIFLFLVITLIVSQNLLAVGLSKLLQLNPLVGMCTGSIPMVGELVLPVPLDRFWRILIFRVQPQFVRLLQPLD